MDPTEIYAEDEQGPIPKFYTPVAAEGGKSYYVEDQARGRYVRDAETGKMVEALRGTERRGPIDRLTGRDDPRLANERTWIDKASAARRTVKRTMLEGAADFAEGAALLGNKAGRAIDPYLSGVGWALGAKPMPGFHDKNVIRTESGEVLGYRDTPGEKAADFLRGQAGGVYRNPNDTGFLEEQLPAGLTQMGTQVAASMALGPQAGMAMFATQAAGREYEAAKQAGATEEQASLAGLLNAPIGALEGIPIAGIYSRVNKATGGGLVKAVTRAIREGGEGALEEAIQESVSQSLSNKVAKEIYDENREVFDGVMPAGQQGGAVGFIASGLMSLLGNARRNPTPQRQAPQGRPWDEQVANARPVGPAGPDVGTEVAVRGAPREIRMSQLLQGEASPAVQADPAALPGQARPGLPMRREVRLSELLGQDVESPDLTESEQAQLPAEQIGRRQQAEAAEWNEEVQQPWEQAREALRRRAVNTPLRDNDHPVAQFRHEIWKRGGIINDGTIEPEVWNRIPARYKHNPGKRAVPNYKQETKDGVTEQTARSKAAMDRAARIERERGDGVKWENLQSELLEIGLGDQVGQDNAAILDLLTGSKVNPDGEPTFPPSYYEEEMRDLDMQSQVADLSREQMEKTPVGQVIRMFDPSLMSAQMYNVKSDDLEVGDILRIDAHLYQVQEQGRAKVLQDGVTIDFPSGAEYAVNGVVKPDNPLYPKLLDAYNRIEELADTTAPDPAALENAPIDEQAAVQDFRTSLENENNQAIVNRALSEQDNESQNVQQERQANDPQTGNAPRQETQAPRAEEEALTLEPLTPEELEAERQYPAMAMNAEQVNRTVWYHGSPKGIVGQPASSMTKIEGLLGSGFYMTNDPTVAAGYARNGDVYKVNVNIRNAVNMEAALPSDVASLMVDTFGSIDESVAAAIREKVNKSEPGVNVWRAMAEELSMYSQDEMVPLSEFYELFQEFEYKMRELGYDALTHIGGNLAGRGKRKHSVAILLDPSQEFGPYEQKIEINDLKLESLTPEELEQQKNREAAQAMRRKAEEKLNTPLKGSAGDLGQSVLFNDMQNEGDLWSGQSAESQTSAPRTPDAALSTNADLVGTALVEHQAMLRDQLKKLGVRRDDIEDMMGDVTLRALEQADKFDPNKAKIQTWLGTLARNVAKNQFARNTAQRRDASKTASLNAPIAGEGSVSLQDLVPANSPERTVAELREALALTRLSGLEADVRDGVLDGKGVEDIAAEQGLTPQKVRGILRVVGRKAQKDMPPEVREADVVYDLTRKQIPANEFPQAVREQLDFFQRLRDVPAEPYGGAVDRSAPDDLQRRKAALAKAFADPLNPENWKGVLEDGVPASIVVRELVKRPDQIAWPVQGVKISSPKDVMALSMMLRSPYQESFKVLAMNEDGVVLSGFVHTVGSINSSLVDIGVLTSSLPPGTTQVVVAHNHPSGKPDPSPADLQITRRADKAFSALGLKVVDHVITDDWKYVSLKETDLVTFTTPVKSTRVPGKVVVPPSRSVEDVVGNEPQLPEWSVMDRSESRFEVMGPSDLQQLVVSLRQGDPDAVYLVGVDSRNRVAGVTMFASASDIAADDYQAVRRAIAAQPESAAFALLHADATFTPEMLKQGRELQDVARDYDRTFMDVLSARHESLRESGMVKWVSDIQIYRSAMNEVRDISAVYNAGKKAAAQVARFVNGRRSGAEYKGDGIESLDPDTEARLQNSKQITREPWYKRERWAETARAFNRTFPELADTEGRLIYELENTSHVAGTAEMLSQAALLQITEGMGQKQYELFERILAARDVLRSVREGLYIGKELPFWKSQQDLQADLNRWEAQVPDNPEVEASLERRRRYMGDLRRKLVDAKLLPESVRDEDDYFHRLVTEYMQATDAATTTGQAKGLREEQSGYQKRRKGGGDFIVDYLTAEHDVVSHALASLRYKEIRDNIKALADKSKELQTQAKELNRAAVHGGEENYRRVRQVLNEVQYLGEGQSELRAKMLESIADIDVLRPYRAMKAQAIDMWEQATGQNMPGGDPNEVMSEAIQGNHGEAAGYAAGQWFSAIQQEEKFIKESLGSQYHTWRAGSIDKRLVPEGYVKWRPRSGHRMFRAMSISEAVLEEVLDGQRELMDDDVREVLVSAGLFPEWVIPENLARALQRLETKGAPAHDLDRMLQKGVGRWKGYKLMAPWHVVKYTFNNVTGDMDFALALEPKILKYVKRSIEDSKQANVKRQLTPEMEKLAYNGVLGGMVRAEVGSIRTADLFDALSGEKPHLLERYMSKVGGFQKFREDILRLAAYRYYSDAIKRGERPHGASNYEQVEALYESGDLEQAAMMLGKQAMIDYENRTVFGDMMRRRYIPFYSWREGNMIRYFRIMRNLAKENDVLSQETARAGAVMTGRLARKAAIRAAQASIIMAAVTALNRIFHPEEEEALERSGRAGHLILSANEDGTIETVRIEGAITSFLGSLGLEEPGRKFRELMSGDATVADTLKEIAGDAASDWVGGAVPLSKTALEAGTGYSIWPDMFNPRPVRDKVEHVARWVSANHMYNRLTGKPMPEHKRNPANLMNLLLYTTDLGESDYWYIREKVSDYLAENEEGGKKGGFRPSKRDNALYYYRKAVQYDDEAAQKKYLDQYLEMGGKVENILNNLNSRDPLTDLKSPMHKHLFLKTLTPSDRRAYERARDWYRKSIRPSDRDYEIMSQVVTERRRR